MTDDTGIRVEVETVGEAGFVSEIVEENLLRIGQEAMTNAVKHSGAQMIKFLLQFDPRAVVLQIQDNGTGFDLETCAGPKNGHFGLLGIRERAERLGGQVQISSISGKGTTIRVQIPCQRTNGDQLLQPNSEDHEKRS
jgi:signal transduction histidine kinase